MRKEWWARLGSNQFQGLRTAAQTSAQPRITLSKCLLYLAHIVALPRMGKRPSVGQQLPRRCPKGTLAMHQRLTDRKLQALKPAKSGERYEIMDSDVRGFGVRVTDKGQRTFI